MPLSPQNERAGGYFMFQANMLRLGLLGARGSAAGRRGHGLSSSLRVSGDRTPRMLSTLGQAVMPARFKLSLPALFRVRTFTPSPPGLEAGGAQKPRNRAARAA